MSGLAHAIRSRSLVCAEAEARAARAAERVAESAAHCGMRGLTRLAARWAETAWLAAAVHLLRACAVLALLAAAPASAQSDATLLVRVVWSEAGVDAAPAEVAALHHVIAGLAEREGWRYATAWRELSPRLAAGVVRRRWLSSLDERCGEPRDWPRVVHERSGRVRPHPPWSAYVARCRALVETVHAVIAGDVASPCESAPRSWGSTSDVIARERLSSRTWVDVACGPGLALRYGGWV